MMYEASCEGRNGADSLSCQKKEWLISELSEERMIFDKFRLSRYSYNTVQPGR